MRSLMAWISRLLGSIGGGRRDAEMQDELRFHLEMQEQLETRRGSSPEEARRRATLRLGGLDRTAESVRDQRGLPWLDQLRQDASYAARMLRRDPGFTAVALLTLAIGIGATATIFSLLDGVLLSPLPYRAPERLVRVYESLPEVPTFPIRKRTLLSYRHDNQTLDGIAGFTRGDLQLSLEDRPESLRGLQVSANYFTVLGMGPALGRGFTWAEERGDAGVVILSDALWRRRFDADPGVLGRQVRLSGRPFTVVGVMPARFEHVGGSYRSFPQGETVDVWWPLPLENAGAQNERNSHYTNAVARLKPGVTAVQAQADLAGLSRRAAAANESIWGIRVVPLLTDVVGSASDGIRLLMFASALVMLITCANVSSLLLAKGAGRRGERAVRFALGAGRGRLVRQSLAESLLLALPGAACGVVLTIGGVRVLRAVLPEDFPRLHNVHVDWTVLVFSAIVACASAALFGLLPAWHEATDDVRPALHDGGPRTSGGRRTARLRNALVIGEIALASALLITAGLLARSFMALQHAPAGFVPRDALTARLATVSPRYEDNDRRSQFYASLVRVAATLPGATAAGAGTDLPWTGYDENSDFTVVGLKGPDDNSARYHVATPGYFKALGASMLEGRPIDERDSGDAPKVLVVNHALVAKFFGAVDPIGHQAEAWGEKRTIVGVVSDIKDSPADSSAVPAFWFPHAQIPVSEMALVVRTAGNPSAMTADLRRLIRSFDPELPLAEVRTLDDIASAANGQRRFILAMLLLFAGAATVLALVGAYGVLTWSVRQRSRELGIRVALGAARGQVLGLVVGQGLWFAGLGLAGGLLVALASSRVLQTLLFGVSPRDGLTFGIAGGAILTLTILAALGPALSATRTSPVEALRAE
jgi:macrolide transport system ATP-binding/permease protein